MKKLVKIANAISFRELWEMISEELGGARLVLDRDAKTLDGFIDKNSDVCVYLHRVIRQCYKADKCQNLDSSISLDTLFDYLGLTAFDLQQHKNCDLFDIELLEEVAWLVCDRYSLQVQQMLSLQGSNNHPKQVAQVVSLPNYKIKLANSKQ